MAWKVEIGGVDRTANMVTAQPVTIDRPLNDRMTAHLTFNLPVGPYGATSPQRGDEVIIYARDGTTKIFGGIVTKRTISGALARIPEALAQVDAGGYATYTDWCSTSLSYTTGPTLIAVLTALIVAPLGAYGITLDPGQVTGPTLAPFAWDRKRASDALRELMDRASAGGTPYVWTIDAQKRLKAFVPGTDAAPFSIQDFAAPTHMQDVTWTDSDRPAANLIIITCGPDGTEAVTQFWTQAGAATSWVTDIAEAPSVLPPGTVKVGGVTKTVGDGAQYTWTHATHTLALGTDTLPANGTVIELLYTAQFPFDVTATSAASPPIEYRESRPEIKTFAAGQEVANAKLLELDQKPLELTVNTVDYAGWEAGQALTATLLYRLPGVSAIVFIITNVHIVLLYTGTWQYTLSATQSAKYQGAYLERWRELGVAAK